jgi:hypothetical protein
MTLLKSPSNNVAGVQAGGKGLGCTSLSPSRIPNCPSAVSACLPSSPNGAALTLCKWKTRLALQNAPRIPLDGVRRLVDCTLGIVGKGCFMVPALSGAVLPGNQHQFASFIGVLCKFTLVSFIEI